MRKTTYSSVTREMYDATTGEIAQVETIKRQKISIDGEAFYMTFIDMMAPLFELKNGTAKAVLEWLCKKAEFNTGVAAFPAKDRKKCCQELGIANNTLSMALKTLADKKLIAGDGGSFTINPQIFWKGNLLSRSAFINSKEFEIQFTAKPAAGIEPVPNEFEVKGE